MHTTGGSPPWLQATESGCWQPEKGPDAVRPTIGKGGVGIGCVFSGGRQSGNLSMGQVTIGWQLGGQAYSQIILFKNADVQQDFNKGLFEFGVDVTAVALTYGAQAGASTKGRRRAPTTLTAMELVPGIGM